MAQQFKELKEDPSLIFSTHVKQIPTAYNLRSMESDNLFWTPQAPELMCTNPHIYTQMFKTIKISLSKGKELKAMVMPDRGTSYNNINARHFLNLHIGHGKQTSLELGRGCKGSQEQQRDVEDERRENHKDTLCQKDSTMMSSTLYAKLTMVLKLQGKHSAKQR